MKGPLGVTFTPAFEIDGTLTFQPLRGRRAFFNGDIALKPEEANLVIDAIVIDDVKVSPEANISGSRARFGADLT